MFSDGTKRGNLIGIDILDNGYVITFTIVEDGKAQSMRMVAPDISDVLSYVEQFNRLEKL